MNFEIAGKQMAFIFLEWRPQQVVILGKQRPTTGAVVGRPTTAPYNRPPKMYLFGIAILNQRVWSSTFPLHSSFATEYHLLLWWFVTKRLTNSGYVLPLLPRSRTVAFWCEVPQDIELLLTQIGIQSRNQWNRGCVGTEETFQITPKKMGSRYSPTWPKCFADPENHAASSQITTWKLEPVQFLRWKRHPLVIRQAACV